MHGSKSEALQIEAQILELLDGQKSDQLLNERNNLARLEVDEGRPAEAKALLEADLQRAAQVHGKESAEYRNALNYLLENRRYAGDYDAAEAAARERLRLAQESESPEPSDLASALFSLSYVRREQGHLEEADELEKRGITANRAAAPNQSSPVRIGLPPPKRWFGQEKGMRPCV
jgi:tetratricopeptide (TPR) repeat protein